MTGRGWRGSLGEGLRVSENARDRSGADVIVALVTPMNTKICRGLDGDSARARFN